MKILVIDDEESIRFTFDFLRRFSSKFNKSITSVSSDVMMILRANPWPGNVRELEHTLEYACIMCQQNHITADHLPPDFAMQAPACLSEVKGEVVSPDAIIQALEKAGGNKSKAARILGISRRTIYRKMN